MTSRMNRKAEAGAADQGIVIAVVRAGSKPKPKARQQRRSLNLPKTMFVAGIMIIALGITSYSPFKDLQISPQPSSATVEGDTITISGKGVTSSATGTAPYDAGTAHVLYWMLLVAGLIPLEIELRKRK